MAEKMTTVAQLKKLALMSKADFAARIAELASLVVAGLEDARHVAATVTLPVSNWNGGTQTVDHESLLADSSYRYFVFGDMEIMPPISLLTVRSLFNVRIRLIWI